MLFLSTVLVQKNGAGKGIPQHADPSSEDGNLVAASGSPGEADHQMP